MFFPEDEAKSEAGHSFLYAYEKYDPKKKQRKDKQGFEEWAGQITYFRAVNEVKKRKRQQKKEVQFSLDPEGTGETAESLVPEHRVVIDDNRIWYTVEGMPDDARYVSSYVLKPPKVVDKWIQDNLSNDTPEHLGRLWRKVLVAHLMKKKWTLYRINKAFKDVERIMRSYYTASYSTLGG